MSAEEQRAVAGAAIVSAQMLQVKNGQRVFPDRKEDPKARAERALKYAKEFRDDA